MQVVNRIYSNF